MSYLDFKQIQKELKRIQTDISSLRELLNRVDLSHFGKGGSRLSNAFTDYATLIDLYRAKEKEHDEAKEG
ncbi:hypothetical protein LCGC14_2464770 [marine sediment metagenome]|uniref:Uncharacterized protein n=1 Tax=marine sediment metagenome TaxID=412755 RepID=A0A0F9E615_9ZZZZ